MNRTYFFALLSTLCGLCCPAFGASGNPPNIVFILADDMGYGDLKAYCKKVRPPSKKLKAKYR